MGLAIDEDDGDDFLLLQPCAALHGRRCSIYAHRPKCCRTFECRLLQDVRSGAVGVEPAVEHIAAALRAVQRVRDLAASLGQRDRHLPLRESCALTLARKDSADPEGNRQHAALAAAMATVEQTMRKTFLRQLTMSNPPARSRARSRAPGARGGTAPARPGASAASKK
jgi:hypothetical protein